jgi:hypothetical protein
MFGKKENFIDRYKRKRRNKVIKNALLGKKKDIKTVLNAINLKDSKISKNLTKSIKAVNNTIEDSVDKQTVKTKLVALEGALQQQAKVDNGSSVLKKIFVKGFDRNKSGKQQSVKGFYRTIKGKLDSSLSSVEIKTNLDDIKLLPGSVTKSANATRIVSDGNNKYVMKSSIPWYLTEQISTKLGMDYDRKFGFPVMEAVMSDFGSKLGVNIQETKLVPSGVKSVLTDSNSIYTLHKFLPGKSLKDSVEEGLLDKSFNVSFKFNPKEDRRTGLYFTERQKLNVALKHKDLAKIYAFGKSFSNYDMHNENIWYDKNKNKFSLIDNGESLQFVSDFSSLKSAIKNSYRDLDNDQKNNLKEMKNMFKNIEDNADPEKVSSSINNYLNKAMGTNTPKAEATKAKLNAKRKQLVYKYNYKQLQQLNSYLQDYD